MHSRRRRVRRIRPSTCRWNNLTARSTRRRLKWSQWLKIQKKTRWAPTTNLLMDWNLVAKCGWCRLPRCKAIRTRLFLNYLNPINCFRVTTTLWPPRRISLNLAWRRLRMKEMSLRKLTKTWPKSPHTHLDRRPRSPWKNRNRLYERKRSRWKRRSFSWLPGRLNG